MCNLHLPPTGCGKHPSFPEPPRLPGTPRAGIGCGTGALAAVLVAGFLTPVLHYAANPSFPRGLLCGSVSYLAPFPSPRAHVCAFLAASPDTLQAGRSAPSSSTRALMGLFGQIAKGLDPVPRHKCQGRGDLASHLFFLGTKHAFKSQSRFTGKGWSCSEPASCPSSDSQRGRFPSPPVRMFADACIEDASAGQPRPGAASHGLHHSPEAAGAAAKLPVPASICSRVAPLERGARV